MDLETLETGEGPQDIMERAMRPLQRVAGKGWNVTALLAALALVVFSSSFGWIISAAEVHGVTPSGQLLLAMILSSLFVLGAATVAWRVYARNLTLHISLDQEERSRREVEEKNGQLSREIMERKRAEAALRESEERYRRFFDDDLSGFFIATSEGQILACNAAFASLFGFPSIDAALNMNFFSFCLAPEDGEAFLSLLRERKALKRYMADYRRLDGQVINTIENADREFR